MRPPVCRSCTILFREDLSFNILAQSVVVVVGAGVFIRIRNENLIWGVSEFLNGRDPLFIVGLH